MSKPLRWTQAAGFTAKVVEAAIKGKKMLAKLPRHYEMHPDQVNAWKGNCSTHPSTCK